MTHKEIGDLLCKLEGLCDQVRLIGPDTRAEIHAAIAALEAEPLAVGWMWDGALTSEANYIIVYRTPGQRVERRVAIYGVEDA